MSRPERGRLRAATTNAFHSPHEILAPARAAFMRKFEDEVDPDRVLPEEERARRAKFALRAHMIRLNDKGRKAAAARKEAAE